MPACSSLGVFDADVIFHYVPQDNWEALYIVPTTTMCDYFAPNFRFQASNHVANSFKYTQKFIENIIKLHLILIHQTAKHFGTNNGHIYYGINIKKLKKYTRDRKERRGGKKKKVRQAPTIARIPRK
ncbi:hypothetical protein PUN28_015400 [Cardiocondyla obscurior]|uniref:Uncharacterized protein n=1 Tax=Cardiocondyla obscurior TaxID=286306 RepID=A0AAW2EWJ6_9HYME